MTLALDRVDNIREVGYRATRHLPSAGRSVASDWLPRWTLLRMATDPTRHTLLRRIGDPDDRGAWREFEAQYRDLVIGYCLRRGLQHSDAEDILQIVLMSLSGLFQRGFQHEESRGLFRSYLGRIVMNAANRMLSRPRRDIVRLATEVEASLKDEHVSESDEAWQQEWEQHHFRLALVTVRSSYEAKSVKIFERLLAGDSVRTVSQEFAQSEQAVHKVKQRIRKRMEDLVARQIEEENDVPIRRD
jgi:RNA polymerase sigma factor (sigma-70 family)